MQQEKLPYTLGLDIGIASVGWCVLGENRIIDLGVRCFDKAETTDKGESLNKVRRDARLMRRRLRRRAWRLTKLTRLLKRHGVIDDLRFFQPQHPFQHSLWQLRAEGLDRLLNAEEWARVIYHLCKHRGFHWISRAEEKQVEADSKGEGGKVKKGLADTKKRMEEKGYRSAAEMILAEFPDKQRNKKDDYSKALKRELLGEELAQLFRRQREIGNPHATAQLETAILGSGDRKSGLFWEQKPPLAGSDLLNMLGKCTFEKEEYRAPKASFTAERHVWLTRLNNLRIVVDGVTRGLNETERRTALPLPYKQAGDFTYKQLRAALVKAGLLPDAFKFAGLSYPTAAQHAEGKAKDPETEKLVRLPAWQDMRKTLKDKGLETEWESMAGAATGGNPGVLDSIAWVLSVFKDDEEVAAELRRLTLPGGEKMIDALLDIRFDKFHALSLKALRKIVPHMETGLRYDEACAAAGYHHSQLHKAGEGKHKTLPPLYAGRDKDGRMVFSEELDVPRNPVVLRAFNQARKVLNALVRRYGSPTAVHIEMARDLSRPLDERNKVKKAQDEYRERNDKDKAAFQAEFNMQAKSREFEKFQLYREQLGQCAYCQSALEPTGVVHKIFEPGATEIDHALPYSRSFDDSKNNKVLVHSKCNRDKGNRTPYEYLTTIGDVNGERWRNFVAYVESNKSYRLAKRQRLLRKDFAGKAAEEFRERNLNDTRYICRFFKNYVEHHLQLKAGADGTTAKRCVVVSGGLTSLLRARWGLPTSKEKREESDRHHAMDATVVAACGHLIVQRTSTMVSTDGWAHHPELGGYLNTETGEILTTQEFVRKDDVFKVLPRPWKHFRNELLARLNIDDTADLRTQLEIFGTYPPEALAAVRPLFVSRAPQRRNSGAAHKDTIYAQPERLKAQGSVTQKVPLASLTLNDLGKLIDPHRNEKLYAAIRARLEAHGGKGENAFPPNDPLRKPDRDGYATGPVVRTVTKVIDKLSGIPVRGGIAKNDSLLRLDVFTKAKRFYLIPAYAHHRVAKTLPNCTADGETQIDDSFEFQFSIHPNDLIRVTLNGGESILGYFKGYGGPPNPSNVTLQVHDRNRNGHRRANDKGEIPSIGVRTALALDKFHVDTLGNIYPAPPEKRGGLA